jgi:hypothetical protein
MLLLLMLYLSTCSKILWWASGLAPAGFGTNPEQINTIIRKVWAFVAIRGTRKALCNIYAMENKTRMWRGTTSAFFTTHITGSNGKIKKYFKKLHEKKKRLVLLYFTFILRHKV